MKREDQLAIKKTPDILNTLAMQKGIDLSSAIKPVTEAITTFSCRNQIMITQAVQAVCPVFESIAKEYFACLYEIVDCSEADEMNRFIEQVMNDPIASLQEKADIINERTAIINKDRNVRLNSYLRTTVTALQIVAEAAVSCVLGSVLLNNVGKIGAESVVQSGKTKRAVTTFVFKVATSRRR